MKSATAIETTGIIDEQRQLHLDEPLAGLPPGRVRLILIIPEINGEDDETDWLRAVATSPAFEGLKDPTEDIYRPTDGKPFHDQG